MSAVPLQVPPGVPPASSSGDAVSVQNFFDSIGVDTVLRSCDSCEIRVSRLYVAKFSPVLGALIQGASKSTTPANAGAPLPVVQLPESGATLISLFSFVFPLSPVLPPTSAIEATMELLSAAQKYEMSSVLAHIRLCITQQDPPYIQRYNAFRAYLLAQKYGLRHEAVKAAQLTSKFSLRLEFLELEGNIDNMPGAYLHELWTFHERVETYIKSDLSSFRTSSAISMLKSSRCITRASSGIPLWLDYYLEFIPSMLPDFFFFQSYWMQHSPHSTRCPYCGSISPETVRTIWTAIETVVRGSMEKAVSALSILGGETQTRARIDSPTTPLSPLRCLDVSQADVIVRSSDHVDFRVHKSILASSSPVFHDMFSLPQPSNNEVVDGLPMVQLSEDAELVRALITAIYPIPCEMPASYDRILALLSAAQKYDMGTVQSTIRSEVSRKKLSTLNGAQVFRTYAIASSWRLIPEMDMAARLSLDLPMTFECLGVELRLFEGWALRALVDFRNLYRKYLISCFESFLDTSTGPSKIWVACPGSTSTLESPLRMRMRAFGGSSWRMGDSLDTLAPRIDADEPGDGGAGAPRLPAWLHNVFKTDTIRSFERPLVGPSDIRAKYLSAMREHVTTDECTFCLKMHALEGEKYIVELERALTQIRNKTTLEVY